MPNLQEKLYSNTVKFPFESSVFQIIIIAVPSHERHIQGKPYQRRMKADLRKNDNTKLKLHVLLRLKRS